MDIGKGVFFNWIQTERIVAGSTTTQHVGLFKLDFKQRSSAFAELWGKLLNNASNIFY